MTIAATTISMGTAIAIFRRTARSCAAPFACQAAQRSSELAASDFVVDTAAGDGAAAMDRLIALREGLTGMAQGSEKQELQVYPNRRRPARRSSTG